MAPIILRMSIYFLAIAPCIVLPQLGFSQHPAANYSDKIDSLAKKLETRGQLNGSLLVTVNELPIFKTAYGKSDIANNVYFTITTPCYLASVGFTNIKSQKKSISRSQ
jgi:CubicO group peptidase (beta-lactamase class C family)